jgi:hypothetical protein
VLVGLSDAAVSLVQPYLQSMTVKEFHSYHFTNRTSFARSFFSTGGTKLNIHKAHLPCDGLGKHRECSGIRTLQEKKKKNLTGIPWKTTAVCFADTKVLTGNKSKKLLMFEITPTLYDEESAFQEHSLLHKVYSK